MSGWDVIDEQLQKEFTFEQYQAGLVFASAVGYIADRLDHHPDMLVGYKKVTLSVSTHSTGGLSPFDFEFARRVDRLTD